MRSSPPRQKVRKQDFQHNYYLMYLVTCLPYYQNLLHLHRLLWLRGSPWLVRRHFRSHRLQSLLATYQIASRKFFDRAVHHFVD